MYDPSLDAVPVAVTAGFLSKQKVGFAFAATPGGLPATFRVSADTGAVSVGVNPISPTTLAYDHLRVSPGGDDTPAYIDLVGGPSSAQGQTDFRLINEGKGWLQIYGGRTADGARSLLFSIRGHGSNSFDLVSAPTGSAPIIGPIGDPNGSIALVGAGTGGAQTGAYIRQTDPTINDIPSGRCADWNNTVANTFKHICDFSGSLHSISLD
jgi:hypothetical protein